jgi:hypothetical protein
MFFTALLAFGLRCLLWWENKKMDKQYGTIAEQRAQAEASAIAGDPKATGGAGAENYGALYRYIL